MSSIQRLNAIPPEQVEAELLTCCGSREWARQLAAQRPFAGTAELLDTADAVWWSLDRKDWLEAFRSHPRIGERTAEAGQTVREKQWSVREQAGLGTSSDATRRALAEGNLAYEARFGHIYLVCAAGKSGEELLAILSQRLANDPETEMRVAAEEQRKITHLRLEKLLSS
jgi:OHCU decarboxylase